MSSINILTEIKDVKTEIKSTIRKLDNLFLNFEEIESIIKNKILTSKQNKEIETIIETLEKNKYSEADKCIIEALLQGYISDKEIISFLEKNNLKKFNPRYQIQKLMIEFNAPSRNYLLRILIKKFSKSTESS